MANWLRPSPADALPAVRGWSASASAVALGKTRPMHATSTKKLGRSTGSPTSKSTEASTPSPPTALIVTPASSSARGPTRSTSARPTWLAATRPPALSAKSRLKTWGEAP